jgi:hypothetical protein
MTTASVDLTAAHGDDDGDAIATVFNGRIAIPLQQTARRIPCTLTVQSRIGTTITLHMNVFFHVNKTKQCRTSSG